MTKPNPWGSNWHNENYSSAEMEALLNRIFGPKCVFMGFQPAGKQKWVKPRTDGTMEVVYLHSDRGFQYSAGFGLSFPWIPHGDWKKVCWHRTPKTAVLDLRFEPPDSFAWLIPQGRSVAAKKAETVSTQVCEVCELWFAKMSSERDILEELEHRQTSPGFYHYVQELTVYVFWQARMGKWKGLDALTESQLKSYFGEDGFPELRMLIELEARRSVSG